jgi:preprotein translocase subunit YajC
MLFEPEGKLLVVILVLVVILLGLAAFLFYLERRLTRAEKQIREIEPEIQSEDQITTADMHQGH